MFSSALTSLVLVAWAAGLLAGSSTPYPRFDSEHRELSRQVYNSLYDAGYAAALGEREPDVCEACAKADEEEAAMLADPNSEFRQAFENRHDIARVIKEPADLDAYGRACQEAEERIEKQEDVMTNNREAARNQAILELTGYESMLDLSGSEIHVSLPTAMLMFNAGWDAGAAPVAGLVEALEKIAYPIPSTFEVLQGIAQQAVDAYRGRDED